MAEDYAAALGRIVQHLSADQKTHARLHNPRVRHDEITADRAQGLSEVERDELVLPPNYRPGYERRLARNVAEAEEYLRKYGRPRRELYPPRLQKTAVQLKHEGHETLVKFVETRRKIVEINNQPLKRRV